MLPERRTYSEGNNVQADLNCAITSKFCGWEVQKVLKRAKVSLIAILGCLHENNFSVNL